MPCTASQVDLRTQDVGEDQSAKLQKETPKKRRFGLVTS